MKKKPAKKTDLETAKRKQGRPKKDESPVTPGVLHSIGEMWLKRNTYQQIADAVGLHKSTVKHHLDKTIKPLWKDSMIDTLSEDLERVKLLEMMAYCKNALSENMDDLGYAKWAIENRAKVAGHYAPTKMMWDGDAEIRVAGLSPVAFDEATLLLILEKIKERREYQEARVGAGDD